MGIEQFRRITIIGLGLIGGSFALALRRAGFSGRIIAWGGTRGIELATQRGVIDGVERAFTEDSMCESDLIYLAAPISGIIDFLRSKAHLVKPGALITDAGSTKREICSVADKVLRSDVRFVGGHPIAGKEGAGFENAALTLFDETRYVLTPSRRSSPEAVEALSELSRACGAEPIIVSPEMHDRTLALTSHVPQLVSSALASLIHSPEDLADRRRLTGSGYRSMTRLAASPFSVWADILESNRDHVAAGIEALEAKLGAMREALSLDSSEARRERLRSVFEEGNEAVSGSARPRESSRET